MELVSLIGDVLLVCFIVFLLSFVLDRLRYG